MTSRSMTTALLLLVATAAPVAAQGTIASQRIGPTTYHNGTLDGRPVSGTSQQIGSFTYTSVSHGGANQTATTQRIGSGDYTTTSFGATATTQLGSFSYTTTSQGTRYTAQRIGDFSYTTGSNGYRATTQRIGVMTYTNITVAEARGSGFGPRASGPAAFRPALTAVPWAKGQGSGYAPTPKRLVQNRFGTMPQPAAEHLVEILDRYVVVRRDGVDGPFGRGHPLFRAFDGFAEAVRGLGSVRGRTKRAPVCSHLLARRAGTGRVQAPPATRLSNGKRRDGGGVK